MHEVRIALNCELNQMLYKIICDGVLIKGLSMDYTQEQCLMMVAFVDVIKINYTGSISVNTIIQLY